MNNIDMLKIQGTPQPLDKTINEAYIKAIKRHIKNLKSEKERVKNIQREYEVTRYSEGYIRALDVAIEMLYSDINQLKDK